MPAKITDNQKAFALEYATNGGNATAAAKAAGYSEKTAHEIGRQLLHKPHVLELIESHFVKLKARSGAVGLHALVELCSSVKTPASARVAAARALCEHAGLLGSGRDERAASEGAESDMDTQENRITPREVLAAFRQMSAAAGGRAQ